MDEIKNTKACMANKWPLGRPKTRSGGTE